MKAETADFLVIGSGIAGLTFALKAPGRVAIVTKRNLPESNTRYAQGGIAASMGEDDSWRIHEQDTIAAGAGLCDPEAVRLVTREASRLVEWLIALGARFDRSEGSLPSLRLSREGGHSRDRIIHSADHTGREIERALIEETRKGSFQIHEFCTAAQLIVENNECVGAWMWDSRAMTARPILARATVLATGGCGSVYRYTTNPPIATGDGIAVARRIGAMLANMEFIQFHPTSLYHPEARGFLISERVRGEGGLLVNARGDRFMEGLHPLAELAPRDIVARAIDTEMKNSGAECVYLDVTYVSKSDLLRSFPGIYERCLSVGLDITTERIPVTPAAHYMCGGVWTDLWGRSSIPRLYACGEVACTGLHGANRLASNSLLEALVFGERAAIQAADLPPVSMSGSLPAFAPALASSIRAELQTETWHDVGIVRSDGGLARALATIRKLGSRYYEGPVTEGALEDANLLTTAEAITECALMRRESRGTHFNEDCPDRDDLRWARPTLLGRTEVPT